MTDCLTGYNEASRSQEIFKLAVALIEAIVKQRGVGNAIWREATLVRYCLNS